METATPERTPKRKLLDLLLVQKAGMELGPFVAARRADGDAWSVVCAKIFALTSELVTVPWLIEQCGATRPRGSAA